MWKCTASAPVAWESRTSSIMPRTISSGLQASFRVSSVAYATARPRTKTLHRVQPPCGRLPNAAGTLPDVQALFDGGADLVAETTPPADGGFFFQGPADRRSFMYLPYSRRAMVRLCTSSGPSA